MKSIDNEEVSNATLIFELLDKNRGEWFTATEIANETFTVQSTVYNNLDELFNRCIVVRRGSQPAEYQIPAHPVEDGWEFEVGDKFENTHQDEEYMVVGRKYHLDEERPDHHDTYFTEEQYRRHYELGTAESLGGDTFVISERDLLSHPEIVAKTGDDDE